MTLSEYLKSRKLSQADFAIKMRVRQQSVSDWCTGSYPKRKNALKIVKITGGSVTLSDLWGIKSA